MQTLFYSEQLVNNGRFISYLLCDIQQVYSDVQVEVNLDEYLPWLLMFARQGRALVRVETKQVSSVFDFRSM